MGGDEGGWAGGGVGVKGGGGGGGGGGVAVKTRKRWRSAKCTMRWIIAGYRELPWRLVLQRIHELQEQAAVAGHAFAFLGAGFELNAAVTRLAECDLATREFSRSGLNVNERLVFAVTENGVIGNGEHVVDGRGANVGSDIHIFLQFLSGVLRDDAGLQSAGGGVESRRDVGNFSVEGVGVRVGRDFDVLAGVNRGQIALIDVYENPDSVGIGNGEALRGGGL